MAVVLRLLLFSLGGIVCNNSIRVAGDDLTADIQEYMSRQHNVKVSERMAERIKLHVGSALTDLGEEAPEDTSYMVLTESRLYQWKFLFVTRKLRIAWTKPLRKLRMRSSQHWRILLQSLC